MYCEYRGNGCLERTVDGESMCATHKARAAERARIAEAGRPAIERAEQVRGSLPTTGYARTVLAMAINCLSEGDPRGVSVSTEVEKRGAVLLEKRGIVAIERTRERFAGLQVWYVKVV